MVSVCVCVCDFSKEKKEREGLKSFVSLCPSSTDFDQSVHFMIGMFEDTVCKWFLLYFLLVQKQNKTNYGDFETKALYGTNFFVTAG